MSGHYKQKLESLFAQCSKQQNGASMVDSIEIFPKLGEALSTISRYKNIVIYSAGHIGVVMSDVIANIYPQIKTHFTDAEPNKWVELHDGRILPPDELAGVLRAEAEETLVLVAEPKYYSPRNTNYRKTLDKSFYDYGFKGAIDYDSHLAFFANAYHTIHARSRRNYFAGHNERQQQASEVFTLLADDFSKEVYYEYFRYFISNPVYRVSTLDQKYAYFPLELFSLCHDERVVDCGAFTGDTFLEFLKLSGGEFGSYDAFELSDKNYMSMSENIERFPGSISQKVRLHNAGVGAASGAATFNEAGSMSRIGEGAGETVKMVALDDVIYEYKPTLIKMDIEGSEMEALEGAQKIIKNHKPILSICLYHKPQDLINIPLLIKKSYPDYSLYVRKYSGLYQDFDFFDLILYAAPPERTKMN